jgi:pimeloyl-ACP methyl ester carboxylesterase
MTEPRLNHVQCLDSRGLHRMAYWEWGDAANPRVLVCVHGLSRQGRDFDTFAQAMLSQYRVVCPDVVGRGQSDWLADPAGYQIPAYVGDMVTLLARLNASTVHWVGTSMGGLIGLALAALKDSPVQRLVLNDVGPVIEPTCQGLPPYCGDML